MARSVKKVARWNLKANSRVGVKGIPEALASIQETLDYSKARTIKEVYVNAARILARKLRQVAPYRAKTAYTRRKFGDKWPHIRENIFVGGVLNPRSNVLVGVNTRALRRGSPESYWYEYGRAGQPARPWFRPTVKSMRRTVMAEVANGFKREITNPSNFKYRRHW